MDPAIFKAYDIRGLYPQELDADAAYAIGCGMAGFFGTGPVVVGRDMRESGLVLRESLVGALRAEGLDVVDVGRVATPMLYFATARLRAGAGVMITASHNPGAYNGLKVCGPAAIPIGVETGLREIRRHAEAALGRERGPARGALSREDVREAYHESLLSLFPVRPRFKVVIDAGNGIAGEAVEGLLAKLPLQVTRLYFDPDGSFPNHEADPLKPENLEDLSREVQRTRADLGVAFDGDGDRAVFVDERGEPIPADLMTALLARVVLRERLLGAARDACIVYDLRSSSVVAETILAEGATPYRSRVGHAFMKQNLREQGACFGGELSGHYYFRFPEGYVADDATAAMLLFLTALDLHRRPASELWQPFRRYSQSGEVNRRVEDVAATLRRVRQRYPEGEADDLDGLTVRFPSWWFNLRPSNTEPLLRLNLEATTPDEMSRHRDELLALIES